MKQPPGWTKRRIARVGYLAGTGLSPSAIAADLGVSLFSVRQVMTRWHVATATSVFSALSYDVRQQLTQAAARHGLSDDALALKLLHMIATDNLVEAVLDGG